MNASLFFKLRASLAALSLGASLAALAQDTTATRAAELRTDKLAQAPVLQQLVAGTAVRVLSLEGGWAWVQVGASRGWVRAGALALTAPVSAAASVANGREAAGNTALALGVRSLPPRVNRHALIIGISRYADPQVPPLPGARIDRVSATQMAAAMQVPESNIRYLQDEQATGDNIRQALAELDRNVQEGDRVFIHYSGHGTRYKDAAAGGCVEALLAYDGGANGTLTNREMSELLKPLTARTDKLFVMYDACHSGGIVQAASTVRTRGFSNANDEGLLRPKFADISDECGRPVNVKSRNLVAEATNKGALPQDIVHISASRDNEVSFDDELKGGLATQFMRDCMLRDAKDLDGSGALSVDEIRQCAQEKVEKRMQNDPNFKPHHLTLSGNSAFVPTWFSLPGTAAVATAPAPLPVAPPTVVAAVTAMTPPVPALPAPAPVAPAPPEVPPPALTGAQALQQVFDQRDAKRGVKVSLGTARMRIGQDSLDFSVQSERGGYVYVALAGSDNQSLYVLFPNELDTNNRIEAGKPLVLPRPNWRVKAAGPEGTDHVLVMVTESPRDLSALKASRAGPFLSSLNDAQGRAALGSLMTTSQASGAGQCSVRTSGTGSACSDAYGAALVTVEEIR